LKGKWDIVESNDERNLENDGISSEHYFSEANDQIILRANSVNSCDEDVVCVDDNLGEMTFPVQFYVVPFEDTQIREYSEKWFKLREENPETVKSKVEDFTNSIRKINHLAVLRRRPVFLSMMIHIHTTKGKLPYSRATAYRYMVEAYIEHIDIARRLNKLLENDWSFEDKEIILEELAYKLHSSNIQSSRVNKFSDEKRSIQITMSKDEFMRTIKEIIVANNGSWQTVREGDEKKLLDFYISRTGLLHEPEENMIQFSHLSFQEYLTAHRIYRQVIKRPFKIQETIQNEIFSRIEDSKWSEVLLLFFSLYKDASQSILEEFYGKLSDSYDFIILLTTLLSSKEYGIRDEDIDTWVERIINYFVRAKKVGKDVYNNYFVIVEKLYSNDRISEKRIEVLAIKSLEDLISNESFESFNNVIVLLFAKNNISPDSLKYLEDNHQRLINSKSKEGCEIMINNMPHLSPLVTDTYTLKEIISIYETVSHACKTSLVQYSRNWKSEMIRLHWIITNIYSAVFLYGIINTDKPQNLIKKYSNFLSFKNNLISSTWNIYWNSDVWHGHRCGRKTILDMDKLSYRFEYFLHIGEKSIRYSKNEEIRAISDKLGAKYKSKNKKIEFYRAILILFVSSKQVMKKYNVELSINNIDYEEFNKMANIILNVNLLHSYLEDKTQKKIDKMIFANEYKEYMLTKYSLQKMIKYIKDNKSSYYVGEYESLIDEVIEQFG
jgi:hypothetical protein